MEPEVHIIEKYFQEILHCFTMTNIKCKGGKEIDLLAIDPVSGNKFHVEVSVATSRRNKIRLRDTYTSKGRAHRRGLDFFAKQKFWHPVVVKKIRDFFGKDHYNKVLVVWDVENEKVQKQAKKEFGIDIWFMDVLLTFLLEVCRTRGSRDDILRTIELMSLMKKRNITPERIKSLEKKIERRRKSLIRVELLIKHGKVECPNCGHLNKILTEDNKCIKCGKTLDWASKP